VVFQNLGALVERCVDEDSFDGRFAGSGHFLLPLAARAGIFPGILYIYACTRNSVLKAGTFYEKTAKSQFMMYSTSSSVFSSCCSQIFDQIFQLKKHQISNNNYSTFYPSWQLSSPSQSTSILWSTLTQNSTPQKIQASVFFHNFCTLYVS
jgi:hypothetical protein